MSTHEDRPRAGGQADEGLFYPSSASGSDNSTFSFDPDQGFSDSGSTTMMAPSGGGLGDLSSFEEDTRGRRTAAWHGGADFGLLILRLVVGGTFFMHGLSHVFGYFHGQGISGYTTMIGDLGYKYDTILAWVSGCTQLAGGALIVFGLFTPVGAAALLALASQVVTLRWHAGFFGPQGYEYQLVLAAATFAILFAGPGRVSLDRHTPWYRRPVLNGWIFLIIAGGASVAVWYLARR